MVKLLPLSTLLATGSALFWPVLSPADEPADRLPKVARATTDGRPPAPGAQAPAPDPLPASPETPLERSGALAFPAIARWQRPLRRCSRRGRRRFCDGPRQIPEPHGEAAERAERLGLEGRDGWNQVMGGPAPATLMAEVPGRPSDSLLWPTPSGYMGRGFGHTRRGRLRHRLHRGVDIPAEVGSAVRAARGGLVVYADNSVSGYGNMVVILHPGDRRTLYAHLARAAVFAGQEVAPGQVIGEVGRTGLTYAPHLHFEYRVRTRARNPRRLFVERPSFDEEKRMMADAARRRREGRARLAERRAAVERRQRRASR